MSEDKSGFSDLIPSGVTNADALKILEDPKNLDFYRVLGKMLEKTESLDQVKQYIDPETLVREFDKVKNHMKHGRLDESSRPVWEEKIQTLAKELGLMDELGKGGQSTSDSDHPSSSAPQVHQRSREDQNGNKPDQQASDESPPSQQVPAEQVPAVGEEPSPSAAKTEKTSKTDASGQGTSDESKMMADAQQDVEFNKKITESSRSVSAELRQLRQKRGVTRNELSDTTGIPLKDISQIERGRKELTYDLIEQYANGLDMQVQLDFQKGGDDSKDVLRQVKLHIDKVIQDLDIPKDLQEPTRIILHQLAEDGLYKKRFPTLIDVLEYLEEAVKQFSIREDKPDESIFSNDYLFNHLKSQLQNLEYSDIAFDENVKIVAQKLLERYHE